MEAPPLFSRPSLSIRFSFLSEITMSRITKEEKTQVGAFLWLILGTAELTRQCLVMLFASIQ